MRSGAKMTLKDKLWSSFYERIPSFRVFSIIRNQIAIAWPGKGVNDIFLLPHPLKCQEYFLSSLYGVWWARTYSMVYGVWWARTYSTCCRPSPGSRSGWVAGSLATLAWHPDVREDELSSINSEVTLPWVQLTIYLTRRSDLEILTGTV